MIVNLDELCTLRARWASEGYVVVFTNGCFDLLHIGHIRFLEAARSEGDIFVVGVNSDISVRRLKGLARPLVPGVERMAILDALRCVDYVVEFSESTPETLIGRLRPDVHCKGADYGGPTGKPFPEAHIVEGYGGRVVSIPLVEGKSTSMLIEKIVAQVGSEGQVPLIPDRLSVTAHEPGI